MALFGFFKTTKHQTFDFKPRYYDAQKEELQERLQKLEKMKENDPEAVNENLVGEDEKLVRGN